MDNCLLYHFGIHTHNHTPFFSISTPPVLDIAARHEKVKVHHSLRADGAVGLIEHDHVKRGIGLINTTVILTYLAAPFRPDYRITVPIGVADEPDASQRVAPCVAHCADDISPCPGAARARM
jgi:hypothetical protein